MKRTDQKVLLGVWSTGEGSLRGQKVTSFVSGRPALYRPQTADHYRTKTQAKKYMFSLIQLKQTKV